MREEYRMVKEFPNYQISNLGNIKRMLTVSTDSKGRIRTYKEKQLSVCEGSNGYMHLGMRKSNKHHTRYIHQLVAIAFLDHTLTSGKEVDHIDGNILNNKLDNLQLLLPQENVVKYHNKGDMSNIRLNISNKYEVTMFINNRKTYFGPFQTKEIAIDIRTFIVDNKGFVASILNLNAKDRLIKLLEYKNNISQ